MLRVKSILHPTDLSPGSADAFRLAQSMARDYDAALLVLHVYPRPVTLTEGVDYGRPDGYLSDFELSLKRWVAQANVPGMRSRLAEGDPATEIVRVAAAEGCDLIVMGTHGRTGLRRVLMGSVAETVSRTATCPVLTVRPDVHPAETLPVVEPEPPPAAEAGPGDPMREAVIPADGVSLRGDLRWPDHPAGVVVFAHGSGSSRHSPRNQCVAEALNEAGFATLLLDLLDPTEEQDQRRVFDVSLLAERLARAAEWVRGQPELAGRPVGYFGASTGRAAALVAAAEHPDRVATVVSRGGRPDLAGEHLPRVKAPTLLVVGGADDEVLALNIKASERMKCPARLVVVPRATHLFPEPGALEVVAELAADWFRRYLKAPPIGG